MRVSCYLRQPFSCSAPRGMGSYEKLSDSSRSDREKRNLERNRRYVSYTADKNPTDARMSFRY